MIGGFMKFYHTNVSVVPSSNTNQRILLQWSCFFCHNSLSSPSLPLDVRRCCQQCTGGWCHCQKPRERLEGEEERQPGGPSGSCDKKVPGWREHHLRPTRQERASLPNQTDFCKLVTVFPYVFPCIVHICMIIWRNNQSPFLLVHRIWWMSLLGNHLTSFRCSFLYGKKAGEQSHRRLELEHLA